MTPIRYLDVHAHVSFPEFDGDRDAVLGRMREAGVGAIVVGVDLESSRRAVALAEKHDNLWASVGLHPADNRREAFDPAFYASLASHPKVVAVGECGLDYYRLDRADPEGDRARQRENFAKQIEFAASRGKPLMLHCRDAHDEALAMLAEAKERRGDRVRGNVHFFTAPAEIAARYGEIGFTVSFSGVVTFAPEVAATARALPLSAILAETDCPFAAPAPHRGRRNEPAFVVEIVRAIARERGESAEGLAAALLENARRVFGIPPVAGSSFPVVP